MDQLTPMMRQYRALKDQHPTAILLFRLGDFFEAFFEDAPLVAKELGLTLTSRPVAKGQRIPMCGIPHHALPAYLRRLIDRGHRVAICDQVEDPRTARTLVRREVVRVVTPGTVIEDGLLAARENNFLAAVVRRDAAWGLALADLSTGEFVMLEGPAPRGLSEALARWRPREVIVAGAVGPGARDPATPEERDPDAPGVFEGAVVTPYDAWRFDPAVAARALREHLEVATLEAFGVDDAPLAAAAAGALVQYLRDTQKGPLPHLRSLRLIPSEDGLLLDDTTRRALGLWTVSRAEQQGPTLLDVIDLTQTAMGSRLLRRRLAQPLADPDAIAARQDAVAAFVARGPEREALRARLGALGDLERLLGRLCHDAGGPRDLAALRDTLDAIPGVTQALTGADAALIVALVPALTPPPGIADLLRRALEDAPPVSARDGGVIRAGFDPEVDALRAGAREAREWMAGLEASERRRTGIRSLRVGYNQVMGYYIEVSHANAHLVPPDYVRKGTLVGAERYITAEMKERETLILNAQERIQAREHDVFAGLRDAVRGQAGPIQACARALAEVDVYQALAEAAVRHGYVRPRVTAGRTLDIRGGRHPVVERALGAEPFVPNDLTLGGNGGDGGMREGGPAYAGQAAVGTAPDILIVTGPNFGGKSTYIRQAALIVVLAQLGSFVPAERAEIGVVDRIFTRVGATDDLAAGRSTFLSEMIEVARILTLATDRSLVILDEVGRGTSTYDGMSLAWAVVEDLADRVGARTLFATHYHELTEVAGQRARVANAQVLVREDGQRIVFVHRVGPGAAASSYGIHVARLAGVPDPVIHRAREVLAGLERAATAPPSSGVTGAEGAAGTRAPQRPGRGGPSRSRQLALLLPSPVEEALRAADLATMTPLEALNFLSHLRSLLDAPAGGTVVPFPRPGAGPPR